MTHSAAGVARRHLRTRHTFVTVTPPLLLPLQRTEATPDVVVALRYHRTMLRAVVGSAQSLVSFTLDVSLYATMVSRVTCEVSVDVLNVPPGPIPAVHSPHAPLDTAPSATTSWYSTWVSGLLSTRALRLTARLVWIICSRDCVGAAVGVALGSTVGEMDGLAVGGMDGTVLGAAEGRKDGSAEGTADGFAVGT